MRATKIPIFERDVISDWIKMMFRTINFAEAGTRSNSWGAGVGGFDKCTLHHERCTVELFHTLHTVSTLEM